MLESCYVLAISEFLFLKTNSEAEPQEYPSACGTCRKHSPVSSPSFAGYMAPHLSPWSVQKDKWLLVEDSVLCWRFAPFALSHELRVDTLPSWWLCHRPSCASCNHATVMTVPSTNTAEKNLVFLFKSI